jgi:acyl dehydratase
MSMNRDMVGYAYPPSQPWAVTRDNIVDFAHAIGDSNPAYHDDEAARAMGLEGICAPPTFPITVTMAAMQKSFEDPSLNMDFTRVVHSDQRFLYTRPIRVGDDLVVVTTVDEIKSLGTSEIITLHSHVTSHGETVVDTWSKLVVRGE